MAVMKKPPSLQEAGEDVPPVSRAQHDAFGPFLHILDRPCEEMAGIVAQDLAGGREIDSAEQSARLRQPGCSTARQMRGNWALTLNYSCGIIPME
jgi:hypothetical protein